MVKICELLKIREEDEFYDYRRSFNEKDEVMQ